MAPRDGALLGPEAGLRAAAQTPDELDGDRADREEQAILAGLMDDTEREIASEAFDKDPEDLDGDTSIEDAAGDDEEAETEDDDVDPADAEPEDEIDDATGEPMAQFERGDLRVPLRQVRDENRQLRDRLAFLEGRVSTLGQPQQQQQPPPRPDMFSDPEGWERAVRQEAADAAASHAIRQVHEGRVNAAFADAFDEHGAEFQFAFDQFTSQAPSEQSASLARRMINSPDPGAFLMRWAETQGGLDRYRAERDAQEADRIAGMLDARPELLDAITERLNGGARSARERGAPRNHQPQRGGRRSPPSLNSQGGSGSGRVGADPRGFDGSEASIFDYAFSK